uniref:Uncharacterized protein n=1 Tax=Arundo donax TaxID=35708 RepID=A0A0A9FZ27_ARUDO
MHQTDVIQYIVVAVRNTMECTRAYLDWVRS